MPRGFEIFRTWDKMEPNGFFKAEWGKISKSAAFNFDRFSAENPWTKSLVYSRTFEEELTIVKERMLHLPHSTHGVGPDFSRIEGCVAIKNGDRIILHSNNAFRYYFSDGRIPTGQSAESFEVWKTAKLANSTDEIII